MRPDGAQVWAPHASNPHLKCQQQEERFNAVETTVHKVPHEEVVGLRDIATHLWGGRNILRRPQLSSSHRGSPFPVTLRHFFPRAP